MGPNSGISRRRLLWGISGSLAALGLAACEYQTAPSGPPPVERPTPVPVPTQPPRVEAVEVELLIGSISDQNSQAIQEAVSRFHSHYPGIQVRLVVAKQGENQRNILLTLHAAGVFPDVAQIAGSHLQLTWSLSRLEGFARADSSFDIKPYYSRMVDYYNAPGDGLWCLPWSYTTEVLFYNKQHFAEAGVPAPNVNWTWDDLRDAASKLTESADNDGETASWGIEFRLRNLDYVFRSFGGGFSIGDEENSEEIHAGNVAALQFLADLVLKGRVHPYPALGWSEGFALGKVSMAFLPEWTTARLNVVEGLDYDVAPIPQGVEGSVTSFAANGIAKGGSNCFHPDHSWEVIKWFAHADFGEWDVARALLFPEGIPTAHVAANAYCWTTQYQRPQNRRFFLQSFESAMVPFSNSPWWPYLSEGWSGFSRNWRSAERMLDGGASVAEVAKGLEESWESDRAEMAKALSMEYLEEWSCSPQG